MVLIFNKQFRTEEKFFNEIAKKIKTSKTLNKVDMPKWECYQLDSIDVHFCVSENYILRVLDKTGAFIVPDMNCDFRQGYTTEDELQRVRYNRFSSLLQLARDEDRARKEKAKKLDQATKKMQEKQTRLDAELAEKAEMAAVIANAIKRLRGL